MFRSPDDETTRTGGDPAQEPTNGRTDVPEQNLPALEGNTPDQVDRFLAETFPDVKPTDRDKFAQLLYAFNSDDDDETIAIFSQQWMAPLPSPEHMGAYAAVQPDLPERIMAAYELMIGHHIAAENKALDIDATLAKSQANSGYLGITFTFTLGVVSIGATVWLAANGHWQAAIPVGIVSPLTLATSAALAIQRLFRQNNRNGDPDDD